MDREWPHLRKNQCTYYKKRGPLGQEIHQGKKSLFKPWPEKMSRVTLKIKEKPTNYNYKNKNSRPLRGLKNLDYWTSTKMALLCQLQVTSLDLKDAHSDSGSWNWPIWSMAHGQCVTNWRSCPSHTPFTYQYSKYPLVKVEPEWLITSLSSWTPPV